MMAQDRLLLQTWRDLSRQIIFEVLQSNTVQKRTTFTYIHSVSSNNDNVHLKCRLVLDALEHGNERQKSIGIPAVSTKRFRKFQLIYKLSCNIYSFSCGLSIIYSRLFYNLLL